MSATPTRINLRPYRILYWPLLLPVALLMALFNKISPIPFKIYALRVNRIGQMAGNQEELACQLDLNLLPNEFRVYIHRDKPCNSALLKMQKRIFPINNIFLPLFDVCHKLGGLGISSMDMERYIGQDWEQNVTRTPQHHHFNEDEIRQAEKECHERGIDPGAPFVSVLARDTSYLTHINESTIPNSYRNDDIHTYEPAMEYIADSMKVIRLGSVAKKKLKTTHPNIYDYSSSGKRTELLDVYLSAKCEFFMSCSTGLDNITALCFRKPVLYVNFIPVANAPILKPDSIFIPKKFWHTKEKRYLTLTELLDGPGRYVFPSQINRQDLVVHDNTAEEVLAVAKEMKSRLDGTWVETDEDKKRQKMFWSHFEKAPSRPLKCVGLIGSNFLRDNPNWLE